MFDFLVTCPTCLINVVFGHSIAILLLELLVISGELFFVLDGPFAAIKEELFPRNLLPSTILDAPPRTNPLEVPKEGVDMSSWRSSFTFSAVIFACSPGS